ncbi:NAD-dependent epimerase/dehydratase family protein [Lysinibacillus yapensis]|uniref:NAD-dependent epimerase/dehydratase family protein n=1 Tax=Ureibacillus yapensis TaxID=2304605 RepID=A0A396SIH7_9BACL|nr:NAD-dependent epimerase/dehydratase family protein [Lysinibacillus yapensis]RHW40108.1 NAD-dependent epimerase/dehydratase family protein [Lysinibacillus yapensis]
MKMRSALIVGGTGLVGSNLVKLLCDSEEYISVTVIARRSLAFAHPKLIVKVRSFDELEENDIEFADELFCCLGTTQKKAGTREAFEKVDVEYPLHIASLAKKSGIMHAIIITAMGSNEKSPFYYNRVKGKLEKELIALELSQLSIVRPSLLLGDRQEFRLGEKMGEWALAIFNPLLVGPLNKYRPIEADQLALAMKVIALFGKKSPVAIYESAELNWLKMPEPKKENPLLSEDEELFNWDKLKPEELIPLDEEVVFNKEKLKSFSVNQESK